MALGAVFPVVLLSIPILLPLFAATVKYTVLFEEVRPVTVTVQVVPFVFCLSVTTVLTEEALLPIFKTYSVALSLIVHDTVIEFSVAVTNLKSLTAESLV